MSRKTVSTSIAIIAVLAAIGLAVDVAVHGTPSIPLLVATAALVGISAAFPVMSQSGRRPAAPPCMECGHASFASAELGFCSHCGSSRVWQAVRVVR